MPKVLIISEDNNFAEDIKGQISFYLEGFETSINNDSNNLCDIIIVDDKPEVINNLPIKQAKAPTFLLLSPQSHKAEIKTQCIVVNKPIILAEFLDELKSSIARFENSEKGFLRFNNYELRPNVKEIYNLRNNEVIKLTEKEVNILKYLYKAQDRVVSKGELLSDVWEYNPDTSTHTIETHIYRLRQKVEHDDASSQLIETLDGGYRLLV